MCRTNCCKNSASSGAVHSSIVAVSAEREEEYLVKDGGGFDFQTLMDEYGIFIYALVTYRYKSLGLAFPFKNIGVKLFRN